jgi:transglutaminase-like putative cysteine protease
MAAAIGLLAPLAAAEDVAARTFEFAYRASVGAVDGVAKMWIPLPQDTPHQTILAQDVETNAEHRMVAEDVHGNRFVLLERRGGAIDAVLTFRVNRRARTGPETATLSEIEFERYLQPSRMVTTGGKIHAEAQRIAGNAERHRDKARRLYDHIVNTVRYDKSGEGWGRGDAEYACDVRAGNCTDFHSLFIGEARSLGVPSRFVMGFSIPNGAESGEIGGYHCWAEFYDDGTGWLPVDASEAFKDPSRREALFGGLDADRVQFTTGRDLVLPEMEGEPLNFSIYPYVEVNGVASDRAEHSFQFRNVR